jgi:hypothetical protein
LGVSAVSAIEQAIEQPTARAAVELDRLDALSRTQNPKRVQDCHCPYSAAPGLKSV